MLPLRPRRWLESVLRSTTSRERARAHVLAGRVARAAFACGFLGAAASAQQACAVERLSLDHLGAQASLGSHSPTISADGRFVVFSSFSPLVPADAGTLADVYLLDRASGALELISVTPSGTGGNFDSPLYAGGVHTPLHVSDDGRVVAWVSAATDLIPNTNYLGPKAFVRNRASGQTQLVSTSPLQPQGVAHQVRLSADGRFVVFYSASGLLPNAHFAGETYVRNLQTNALEIASLSWNGQPNTGNFPSIYDLTSDLSADGRYVTFASRAPDIVPGGNPLLHSQVYRRDRLLGTTELVSLSDAGWVGDGNSSRSRCSDDGRFVSFDSFATNLDGPDTLVWSDVFVRDMVLGTTRRVSRTALGNGNKGSWLPDISPDGRFIAYATNADNLVPGDTNASDDVLLYDRTTDLTTRVSVDAQGHQGNGPSRVAALAWGARAIVLDSHASNLVAGDTNAACDVLVRECSSTVTYCTAKTNSLGCLPAIHVQGIPAVSWGLPFEIGATSVRNQCAGALVYCVAGSAATPFQGGTLCLQPPLVRTPVQSSHGSPGGADCSGTYAFDFLARVATGIDPALVAGIQVWAQYWSRDNGFPWPMNAGLTDAVTFALEP